MPPTRVTFLSKWTELLSQVKEREKNTFRSKKKTPSLFLIMMKFTRPARLEILFFLKLSYCLYGMTKD